jgi:SAM-dependent methyltransferase
MRLGLSLTLRLVTVTVAMAALLTVLFFPWASDLPLTPLQKAEQQRYYENEIPEKGDPSTAEDTWHKVVTDRVGEFAQQFGLDKKKVLDVGSGRGFLQDVVNDYTGLDISPSAKRLYHKPFIVASATAMPLPDNTFDSAWTLFVLEHVDNPEAAVAEIRRVVKDGGVLFLAPAWDVSPWAAGGYPVRPYSDLGFGGKLIKAFLPVHSYFWSLSKPPMRLTRYLAWKASGNPTSLHYRRLLANYKHYWMADSDAINSLDRYELALWFVSRGDECLNCEGSMNGLMAENDALLIRVHKNGRMVASR